MSTPVDEISAPRFYAEDKQKKDDKRNGGVDPNSDEDTYVHSPDGNGNHLKVDTSPDIAADAPPPSPSAMREQRMRLEDDLALLEAERVASRSTHEEHEEGDKRSSMSRSRSRKSKDVDDFDEATNPLHEKAAVYNPPDNPNTRIAKFVKKLHNSSFVVRYLTYILPLVILLLIPLLLGALRFKDTSVGGVELLWFSVWLEIVWLTLWAGRVRAALRCLRFSKPC